MNTLLILALASPPVWAHEGHDHAAAEVGVEAAPRASAESEVFELVAVLAADGRLILYLDRYASGEPVTEARIEVESGGAKATALTLEPGVYAASLNTLRQPGKHPLTLTVHAGDSIDLLAANLDVPQLPAVKGASGDAGMPRWLAWGAGGLLLGLALLRLRGRGRKPADATS
jgi:hypothetical protein